MKFSRLFLCVAFLANSVLHPVAYAQNAATDSSKSNPCVKVIDARKDAAKKYYDVAEKIISETIGDSSGVLGSSNLDDCLSILAKIQVNYINGMNGLDNILGLLINMACKAIGDGINEIFKDITSTLDDELDSVFCLDQAVNDLTGGMFNTCIIDANVSAGATSGGGGNINMLSPSKGSFSKGTNASIPKP